MASDTVQTLYAFDCGTTNWRIFMLNFEQHGDRRRPVSEPQKVALTTFVDGRLPAALLLGDDGGVSSYGDTAYQAINDPELRPRLRDAFKLCIGHQAPVDTNQAARRYTHEEALRYTALLLQQVLKQLQRERPGCFEPQVYYSFSHPVHWGRETPEGQIEGALLADFAAAVRGCFPEAVRMRVHFVQEPEAALASLAQTGQLKSLDDRYVLVVDAGGGTTDFVVGRWTARGLSDEQPYGEPIGGGLFDGDLARYVADCLKVPPEKWADAEPELRRYGRQLKENLSRQLHSNPQGSVVQKFTLEFLDAGGESQFLSQKVKCDQPAFETTTKATIDSLEKLVLRAVVKGDVRKSDIGQVVLVGGGANLYLLPHLLEKIFEKKAPVVYGAPPEDTIARGTALWAVGVRPQPEPKPSPPVDVLKPLDIHGWSAAQVQQRQKEVAQALGMPVVFVDKLKNGDQGPHMLVIPPGSFLMGSPASEEGRDDDEEQHRVEIRKPFAIGRYAVTFAEYDAFCTATDREKPGDRWGCGNQPVINIDWLDAWAYAEWLTQQTGQHYRLPTEAEWEYAARAGTTTAFWWGNSITPEQANYDGNYTYNNGRKGVYRKKTVAVGEFQPNPWGLYQVHGNVWEWVGSKYQADYGGSELSKNDANKIAAGAIRGGSWSSLPAGVRSAYRSGAAPALRDSGLGVRLARDL